IILVRTLFVLSAQIGAVQSFERAPALLFLRGCSKVGFFVPFCGFPRIEKPLFSGYNEKKTLKEAGLCVPSSPEPPVALARLLPCF
ncbi:hypothetical protein, partial [Anaerotignum lactatifermentans]|uniref:hypothetical protein n=1 Tax=Anaerotignum lactatifermentans TaxID=160404 RepID=UPI00307FFFE5